ncbi:neurofilament heavy polypeptide [Coregonus clupeaformis]|uniref:neurofilament heavy polypeptide n=1 Tax=Coregonus clupeaformis TaxID=59861 RepID=UPI001E1C78B2|nr:neurofilament heavy polypeptide [Coregonus clupeaformis]XP_045066930.1 neurofilament heavy polypeptide [Coregonus clupeaformis]
MEELTLLLWVLMVPLQSFVLQPRVDMTPIEDLVRDTDPWSDWRPERLRETPTTDEEEGEELTATHPEERREEEGWSEQGLIPETRAGEQEGHEEERGMEEEEETMLVGGLDYREVEKKIFENGEIEADEEHEEEEERRDNGEGRNEEGIRSDDEEREGKEQRADGGEEKLEEDLRVAEVKEPSVDQSEGDYLVVTHIDLPPPTSTSSSTVEKVMDTPPVNQAINEPMSPPPAAMPVPLYDVTHPPATQHGPPPTTHFITSQVPESASHALAQPASHSQDPAPEAEEAISLVDSELIMVQSVTDSSQTNLREGESFDSQAMEVRVGPIVKVSINHNQAERTSIVFLKNTENTVKQLKSATAKPKQANPTPKPQQAKPTAKELQPTAKPKEMIKPTAKPKVMIQTNHTPKTLDTKPTPKTLQTNHTPKTQLTKPTPKTQLTKSTPKTLQAKPTPKTLQAKPTPKTLKTKPTPRTLQAKPTPKTLQTKPTPKTLQTNPTPKTLQAKPTPKTQQTKPTAKPAVPKPRMKPTQTTKGLKTKTGKQQKKDKKNERKGKPLKKDNKTKETKQEKKEGTNPAYFPYFKDNYCPPECACYGQVVQCSDKGVEKVPYGIPYNSRYILLMNNLIDGIQLDLLNVYLSMEFLVLSNNRLTDGSIEGAFEGIPALKRLYLDRNLLESVPTDLPASLEELRLDNNRLNVMSEGAWAHCPGLLVLSLSNNSLGNGNDTLPASVLSPLASLRTLSLDRNRLASVPLGLPLSIRELYLRGNLIQKFPGEAFMGTSELVILDLSANRLTNHGLLRESLLNATHLESLNLEGNQLKKVPRHLPSSLKTLNLEGNLISSVGKASFLHLSHLEHLGLARNKITRVASGAFKGLPVLHQLDLCHNALRQVPRQLPRGLHLVALTHNKIHSVPRDAFCWGGSDPDLSSLVRVQLEHNLIDLGHLDAKAFHCLRGFQVIHFY